jgi:hypothetical protein
MATIIYNVFNSRGVDEVYQQQHELSYLIE